MNKYLLAVAVALGLMLMLAGRRIMELDQALEAKPKIEIRTVEKIKTVRVAGPVEIRERIIVAPDGTKTIERATERGQVVTNTGKESELARSEEPVRSPVIKKTRFAGLTLDPGSFHYINGVRGGMTLFDSVDLAAGYHFQGRATGFFADAALRF